jgi:hypothetical protein
MGSSASKKYPVESPMQIDIKPGNFYLLQERKAEKIFILYKLMIEADKKVTCVSRIHPDQLNEDFGIPHRDSLWLSNTIGERNVNPLNVGILTDRLIRYFEEGENRVVLFEGLEYLVMQNDFGKVLRLVNYLYESVAVTKNVIIISLDPRAFSAKELAFLEKSAYIIDEKDKISIPK